MRKRKAVEVQKFGGAENVGSVREEGNLSTFHSELSNQDSIHENVNWDLQSVEVQSDTKLEQDEGVGGAAIIRMFQFGMNLDAFKQHPPTKQELFNSHLKGIELALWKDGMKVMPDIEPKVVVDEKSARYMIFVGAVPMRGHILRERPQTLAEIAHGERA